MFSAASDSPAPAVGAGLRLWTSQKVMHSSEIKQSFGLLCKRAMDDYKNGDKESLPEILNDIKILLEREDNPDPRKRKIFDAFLLRFGISEESLTYDKKRYVPEHIDGVINGISLVTCARNRTENLLRCLPTWLHHKQIDELIVIDWNSDIPVRDALDEADICDSRIRVVRVLDEPRWILTYGFNLGFRLSLFNSVMKVDADIELRRDFFDRNTLLESQFIAGNWEAAEPGQEHINGFFYVKTGHLAAINGFNEYITTYGWDDDDIYSRLNSIGAVRTLVDTSSIFHLEHDDSSRTGEFSETQAALSDLRQMPLFHIRKNRYIASVAPSWNSDRAMVPFEVVSEGAGNMEVRRVVRDTPHYVSDDIHLDSEYYAALELVSWRVGPQAHQVPRDRFLDLLMTNSLDEISTDIVADASISALETAGVPKIQQHVVKRQRIFIDAQHGLGNRLRAIGSAAAIADATDRELVIIWEPDHHCEGKFSDIFECDSAVIEKAFLSDALEKGCKVYNYMEIEDGSKKGAALDLSWSGDIYARTAYVLNAVSSTWHTENRFLRELRPTPSVRDLVASVPSPNDVSAHVRMVGGAKYEHIAYEALENWTERSHAEIDYWRRKSHFSHFIKRIDTLISEGRADRIFLAADNSEAYDAFVGTFGGRIVYLPRELYDRSAEQLRFALADALLLGSASTLLGSNWSSFSELAMRLSPNITTIEMSGENF